MNQNNVLLNDGVDLESMGKRLGLIVAKYDNGREDAQEIANISSFTLDRYLAGKTQRVDLVAIAAICKGQDIRMDWMLYGNCYSQRLDNSESS